jgi:hypothetical protein
MKLLGVTKPAAVLNFKVESFHDPEAEDFVGMDGNIDVFVKEFTHKVLTKFKD